MKREEKREKRDLFRLESASRLFLSCIGIVSVCSLCWANVSSKSNEYEREREGYIYIYIYTLYTAGPIIIISTIYLTLVHVH